MKYGLVNAMEKSNLTIQITVCRTRIQRYPVKLK